MTIKIRKLMLQELNNKNFPVILEDKAAKVAEVKEATKPQSNGSSKEEPKKG